jgi:hypothetical protein
MQALFAAENSGVAAHQQSNPLQSRIQGIASTDFGPAPSARPTSAMPSVSSSGPRQMESMGNPYFNNYSPQPSNSLQSIMQSDNPTKEIISAVTSGVQSVAQTLAKAANPYLPSSMQQSESSFYSTPTFQPSQAHSYQAPRSEWSPPKLDSVYITEQPSTDTVKAAVNELCMANPARVIPSQQSLDAFVSKCNTLDGLELANALSAKLVDPSVQWTHKMKVLAGLEALHAAGLDVVSQAVRDNPAGLFGLLSSPQCGAKARSVAVAFGVLDGLVGQQQSVKKSQAMQDLIDVGIGQQPAPIRETSGDLLDFGDSPVPACKETSGDLLDFSSEPVVKTSRTPSPALPVVNSSDVSLI